MTDQAEHGAASLAAQWADAPTLYEHLERCAVQIRDNKRIDDRTSKASSEMSTMEGVALILREHAEMRLALDQVKRDVNDDLVAARVVCVGRHAESNELEKIPPSFWIGATPIWGENSAIRGQEVFVDLRVLTEPKPTLSEPEDVPKPGRPSKKSVIREAIAEHAKSDPGLLLPRSERFKAYRSYISEKGYNPRRDSGFGDKTIEKYETEFRRKCK